MHRLTLSIVAIGALAVASPAVAAPRSAPNHKISHSTSSNWSGYDVTGHGPYSSVSSSWVVPAVNCTATAYSSFWVGLDGDTTNTVEQTGTDSDCNGLTPSYFGWYEMYPKFPANFGGKVAPGDMLSASVTVGGRGVFTLVLSNATRGWTATTSQMSKKARLGSAEVIAEAPSSSGGVLPLANFGKVNFGASNVNGVSLASQPGLDPITMVQSNNQPKATPSGISSTGAFSVTWNHS